MLSAKHFSMANCRAAPFLGVFSNGVWNFDAGIWFAAGGFNMGSLGGLALPILFFIALYVLMIVPNQRKQKKWQQMLAALNATVETSYGKKGAKKTK